MTSKTTHFHGSYQADDVVILLKPLDIQFTQVQAKEKLIQSGKKHYSEMLSPEYQPSQAYLDIFHQSFARNKARIAAHAWLLAREIARQHEAPVLVSLARAGLPVGVLLKRILKTEFGIDAPHYAISIIRDRGLDEQALRYILKRHDGLGRDLVFVDGWTGKGVIGRELTQWTEQFNQQHNTHINSDLYVLTDISGTAAVSASLEDYLIPSALLNSTVSGLISRSVLSSDYTSENEFHACKFYQEWQSEDLSQWYIENIVQSLDTLKQQQALPEEAVLPDAQARQQRQQQSQTFMQAIMNEYQISNINLVKPGIGEAIRELLRRVPECILIRDPQLPEIQPFLVLAEEKNVPVQQRTDMPYQATGIISRV